MLTPASKINEERKRILMYLDAIKADCDRLVMDVEKTLRIDNITENDVFTASVSDNGMNIPFTIFLKCRFKWIALKAFAILI